MKPEDFHHFISGTPGKPWLIFLHGLLGAAANWRRITPAFEPDFRILTYDQRGHGRSFKPKTGYAPEDFAGDLKFLMDSLGIPKASVVGHSMGGRNALTFANLWPERVGKLVIEDIGPDASVQNGTELIQKLKKVPVPFPSKKEAKEYMLGEFGNPKLGGFLYTDITTDSAGRAVWDFDLDAIVEIIQKGRGSDRWHEIKNLKVPTLVIRGTQTDELPRDVYEKMLKLNPLVKGIEIQNAAHWVHFDKPKEFTEALKAFL